MRVFYQIQDERGVWPYHVKTGDIVEVVKSEVINGKELHVIMRKVVVAAVADLGKP